MNKALFLIAAFVMAVGPRRPRRRDPERRRGDLPYPVYSAWAFEYSKVSGMQLNYQSIGSGGGIKQITERTVDFGASDKPLKPENWPRTSFCSSRRSWAAWVFVVNIPGSRPVN